MNMQTKTLVYWNLSGLVAMFGMLVSIPSCILVVHCRCCSDEIAMRNEGVGIALDKMATEA